MGMILRGDIYRAYNGVARVTRVTRLSYSKFSKCRRELSWCCATGEIAAWQIQVRPADLVRRQAREDAEARRTAMDQAAYDSVLAK